jgi:hypothetical protein
VIGYVPDKRCPFGIVVVLRGIRTSCQLQRILLTRGSVLITLDLFIAVLAEAIVSRGSAMGVQLGGVYCG